MKLTSFLYQIIIKTINSLPIPIRMLVLNSWKKSRVPFNKFYKDLRYKGKLQVSVGKNTFQMNSTGGTIENEIFWKGLNHSLEPETIWIWEELIKRNVTNIIDIGANTGIYSLLSYVLNNDAQIIAFEPSAKMYTKLNANIELNKFNIKTEQLALSNMNGELVFYDLMDENQTSASLSSKMIKDDPNSSQIVIEYPVRVSTLDKYMSTLNISQIDLIKIDVELHEPEVFEGMLNTINLNEPFLLFEVLVDDVAEKLNDYFLNLPNYSIYSFCNKSNSFYLSPIEKLIAKPNGNWNYFACHENKKSLIKELFSHKQLLN